MISNSLKNPQPGSLNSSLSLMTIQKYYVKFNDKDFKKFTVLKLNSNNVLNLLLETSRVEFNRGGMKCSH